jgi:hypothetical protein
MSQMNARVSALLWTLGRLCQGLQQRGTFSAEELEALLDIDALRSALAAPGTLSQGQVESIVAVVENFRDQILGRRRSGH